MTTHNNGICAQICLREPFAVYLLPIPTRAYQAMLHYHIKHLASAERPGGNNPLSTQQDGVTIKERSDRVSLKEMMRSAMRMVHVCLVESKAETTLLFRRQQRHINSSTTLAAWLLQKKKRKKEKTVVPSQTNEVISNDCVEKHIRSYHGNFRTMRWKRPA